MKLFAGGCEGLKVLARIVPETKLQRMPHDRFPDLLAMGRELIADRRANEIRAVRIKALLHQQVDMAEVDVAEIDRDLLGVARPVAELVNFTHRAVSI